MSGKVKPVVNRGQTSQTRRRLDAGEARHGGTARVCVSGGQTSGGEALRVAGALPHPTGLKSAAGVAGSDGEELGRGGRSSVVHERRATVRLRTSY